jgi:antitoxin FitA
MRRLHADRGDNPDAGIQCQPNGAPDKIADENHAIRQRTQCPRVNPRTVQAARGVTDLDLLANRYHDIMIPQVQNRGLPVAQFVVRHLEDDVKARLKRRAANHGRSMEEEVRHILRDAVKEQNNRVAKLGSRIAARFAKAGLATDLPELRGQTVQSAEFDK